MRKLLLLVSAAAALSWAADTPSIVVSSAASNKVGVAPDSLASIYGDKLATERASAGAPPWPTSLGDMPVVWVTDAASNARMAPLLFVSPGQMNIWIPPDTAPGPATISFPVTGLPIGVGTAALRTVAVTLQKVAPGLFSADGTGAGVAAATAVRVVLPTDIQSPVEVFHCAAAGGCKAVPIDPGLDAPVYLSFYGTGIRRASSPDAVTVTIGGAAVKPSYAGPQPDTPGLDQVNVPLPLSLRGRGLVDVTVTVDGVVSNAVQIAVQ